MYVCEQLKCTCLCIAAVVIIVNGHLPSACLLSPLYLFKASTVVCPDYALNDDTFFFKRTCVLN